MYIIGLIYLISNLCILTPTSIAQAASSSNVAYNETVHGLASVDVTDDEEYKFTLPGSEIQITYNLTLRTISKIPLLSALHENPASVYAWSKHHFMQDGKLFVSVLCGDCTANYDKLVLVDCREVYNEPHRYQVAMQREKATQENQIRLFSPQIVDRITSSESIYIPLRIMFCEEDLKTAIIEPKDPDLPSYSYTPMPEARSECVPEYMPRADYLWFDISELMPVMSQIKEYLKSRDIVFAENIHFADPFQKQKRAIQRSPALVLDVSQPEHIQFLPSNPTVPIFRKLSLNPSFLEKMHIPEELLKPYNKHEATGSGFSRYSYDSVRSTAPRREATDCMLYKNAIREIIEVCNKGLENQR